MKFRDAVPDVLISRVPERLVIDRVGPQDGALTVDPVQPDRSIVEVVEHVLFGPLELCRCHGSQSLQFRLHVVDPDGRTLDAQRALAPLKLVGLPGRHNQVSSQRKPPTCDEGPGQLFQGCTGTEDAHGASVRMAERLVAVSRVYCPPPTGVRTRRHRANVALDSLADLDRFMAVLVELRTGAC